jgi:hypothetical protein
MSDNENTKKPEGPTPYELRILITDWRRIEKQWLDPAPCYFMDPIDPVQRGYAAGVKHAADQLEGLLQFHEQVSQPSS